MLSKGASWGRKQEKDKCLGWMSTDGKRSTQLSSPCPLNGRKSSACSGACAWNEKAQTQTNMIGHRLLDHGGNTHWRIAGQDKPKKPFSLSNEIWMAFYRLELQRCICSMPCLLRMSPLSCPLSLAFATEHLSFSWTTCFVEPTALWLRFFSLLPPCLHMATFGDCSTLSNGYFHTRWILKPNKYQYIKNV